METKESKPRKRGMNWTQLVKMAVETVKSKGLRSEHAIPSKKEIGWRLALIHTEVSEAAQLVKRNASNDIFEHALADPEVKAEFAEEIADVMIRCIDLADFCGFDLGRACMEKASKNLGRPYKYGTPDEGKDAS